MAFINHLAEFKFSVIYFLSDSEQFKPSISFTYSSFTVTFGRVLLFNSTSQFSLFFATITSGLKIIEFSSEYFVPGLGFNNLMLFIFSLSSSSLKFVIFCNSFKYNYIFFIIFVFSSFFLFCLLGSARCWWWR